MVGSGLLLVYLGVFVFVIKTLFKLFLSPFLMHGLPSKLSAALPYCKKPTSLVMGPAAEWMTAYFWTLRKV